MKYSIYTVLAMLSSIAVAAPSSAVADSTDTFPEVSFNLISPSNATFYSRVAPGSCVNMIDALTNNVASINVPAYYACSLYSGLNCNSLATPFGPGNLPIPAVVGSNTGSYRCSGY